MVWWIMCLINAVLIKSYVYKLYARLNGLEALSAIDDFWLYDAPINPINVPSFIVFDKPDVPTDTFINRMNERLGREHRCAVKLVKFWGKYFF